MTKPVKLIKIGNSVGMILPKDVLARLRVELGDDIFLSEAPNGLYSLGACDPDFATAMAAAAEIMREDRDILAVLAK